MKKIEFSFIHSNNLNSTTVTKHAIEMICLPVVMIYSIFDGMETNKVDGKTDTGTKNKELMYFQSELFTIHRFLESAQIEQGYW